MTRPTSISTLADYCMQRLGAPVIDIHVAEEQVQNCIDDAFDFFTEFHGDATERTFLKYQLRGNEIATPAASSFTVGETIVGQVSGAITIVRAIKNSGTLIVYTPIGTFLSGETIVGSISATNSTLTTYTQGDIDRGWIPVASSIVSVINVYPVMSASSNSMFSYEWQFKFQNIQDVLYNGGIGGLAQYEATREYLNTIQGILTGEKIFRFNRHTQKLYIDMDWQNEVSPGDYVLVECFRALDPTEYASVFDDRMLKKLATAYVKKQWGSNVKLHSGIVLPGGITVNGQIIYDEAIAEIEKIEEQIQDTYQEPCGFLIG